MKVYGSFTKNNNVHYFFGNVDLINNTVIIENEEAHHCAKVLRLKEGNIIGILPHQNTASEKSAIYIAELTSINKKQCQASIKEIRKVETPSPRTHLIISPPKNNERIEWLVEKSVELQAYSLLFVKSERCIRKTLNLERLKKIILSAAKQCGNPLLPKIELFDNLKNLIRQISINNGFYILLHCEKSVHKIKLSANFLYQIKQEYSDIYVFIGPEGDWTSNEINTMLSSLKKISEIDMGNIRLRSETAAISILSVLRIE